MVSNVSNFDRILAEIEKESRNVAPKYALSQKALTELVVSIVDLEDQRQKGWKSRIKRDIETMILGLALSAPDKESV